MHNAGDLNDWRSLRTSGKEVEEKKNNNSNNNNNNEEKKKKKNNNNNNNNKTNKSQTSEWTSRRKGAVRKSGQHNINDKKTRTLLNPKLDSWSDRLHVDIVC